MANILDGIREGSINGSVVGNPSLVGGLHGQALQLNNINDFINYGNRSSECYANPAACTDGVTFSFWIQQKEHQSGFILASTRYGYDSYGYYIRVRDSDRAIKFSVKEVDLFQYISVKVPDINVWYHVAFTWRKDENVTGYINGCDAGVDEETRPRSEPFRTYHSLYIGDVTGTPIILDEMLAWNDKLTDAEIQALYANGGII